MKIDRVNGPELKQFSELVFKEPEKVALDSGLEICMIDGLDEEILQVDFVFNFGKKNQGKPLQAGLAVEMLFEGTDGRTGKSVMDELDGYGAYVNSSVGLDRISISLFSTVREFGNVFSLMMSILANPNYDKISFEKIKNNFRQIYLIESEKVSVLARRAFRQNMFLDHPYGQVAQLSDYDRVTVEDCKSFYDDLVSSQLTVFVAGHLNEDVKHILISELSGLDISFEPQGKVEDCSNNRSEIIRVEKKGALQSGIRIGRTTIGRHHPEFPELQVLLTMFGGYFGSRLMMNIREDKGYTYGIGAGVAAYDHAGMLFIATECGAQYENNVLAEINFEIQRLKEEKIPEEELFLVKNYLQGSLAKSTDGPFEIIERFKAVYYSGLDLNYYNQYLNTVIGTTGERMNELAGKYLDVDEMLMIIAGESN